MNKVTWHITMSVDGFIAGPDDEMEWAFGHSSERDPIAEAVRTGTGAILAGRRWHDGAMRLHDGVAGIYGGDWSGPVFVLTHRLEDPPGEGVSFLSGTVEDAVATARAAAGGCGIGIFGANLAAQCLDAGLVDEIVVHVAPVLLGDGVRLYGAPGANRVALERVELGSSGQLTSMRFRVTAPGPAPRGPA
jgi:dihydrofolate reductase